MKTPEKDAGQLKLRVPEDLKSALRADALANDRTLNAEIVNRLRSTFKAKRTTTPKGTP